MSEKKDLVTVEFYGIPRQRAGRAELAVAARTVAELLEALARACPGLAELRQADGRLAPHYLLSIDGQRFVSDSEHRLRPGERVLLLSADVGG
jgi:molybdopterin converting factor small subunit